MRKFNKTEEKVIEILKDNYYLADNFRKVYVEYLARLGYDFNAEIYIKSPGLSDATINKALETVLKEIVEDGWAFQKLGFTVEAYHFFRKCRYRGKLSAEECRRRAIGATAEQVGNLKREDAERNSEQGAMFAPNHF